MHERHHLEHDEGIVARPTPGPALYQVSCVPDAPRAIVGIVPGYADHAARYRHVMAAWAEERIASVALDLRGHGRAEGPRGHCARFADYFDDVAVLARLLDERAPDAPAFLFGHSFGGLVALLDVLDRPRRFQGLLLSSPYIDLALPVPAVKRAAGRVASRVLPRLALPTGITGAHVTHDPERARRYDTDPLVFKRATARWFSETSDAQQRALDRAPALALPLFLVVGGADPVARVEAGRALFERAGSADKTWDERPGLRHEVVNEIEWMPIVAAMAGWMLARAAR